MADNGIRSGVYELAEVSRIDRRFYCQHPFFKEHFLEKSDVLESECRDDIQERIEFCEEEICPPCIAQCNTPTVRTIAAIFKCTFLRDSSAFTFGLEVSDQGANQKKLAQSYASVT
ncbi:MAG: hypothetical protein VXA08_09640 [Alphaproteobacteria bacterium]